MARIVFIATSLILLLMKTASSQNTPSQACIDAAAALEQSTQCDTSDDDLSILCGTACRNLVNAVFDNCPTDSVSYI